MFFNDYYNSPIGNITMASDGESLCGLWFDGQKYFASTVKGETEDKTLPVFEQTKKWLDIYFSGNEPDFTPKLSLNGSEFRKAVWDILLTIPYGSVMTYGEIAKNFGKTAWRCQDVRTGGRWCCGPQSRFDNRAMSPCCRDKRKPYGLCGRHRQKNQPSQN